MEIRGDAAGSGPASASEVPRAMACVRSSARAEHDLGSRHGRPDYRRANGTSGAGTGPRMWGAHLSLVHEGRGLQVEAAYLPRKGRAALAHRGAGVRLRRRISEPNPSHSCAMMPYLL